MATIIIKSSDNDNQALVDSDGRLLVNPGGSGSLSNVNIFDSFGNTLSSTSGALNVNINGVNPSQNSVLIYNQVTSVPVGVSTPIATYTAPSSPIVACLIRVTVAGQNVGKWTISNSGDGTYDQNFTSAAYLNEVFDFGTGSSVVPGQIIGPGNTITVSIDQVGQSSADFNARIQVLEIG